MQVVGFIYGHQVPLCRQGLRLNVGSRLKQIKAAQYQLFCFKRVALRHLRQPVCVKQGKMQVEATQHLHQPLVQKASRD